MSSARTRSRNRDLLIMLMGGLVAGFISYVVALNMLRHEQDMGKHDSLPGLFFVAWAVVVMLWQLVVWLRLVLGRRSTADE
jgi:hypothetical protein